MTQEVYSINSKQRVFLLFLIFVLADLVVINLFDEYAREYFYLESFTDSIFMALILQILLKFTIQVEHKIGNFFSGKTGSVNLIGRILVTWALLFGSKIIMMLVIDKVLGDGIQYFGPYHGLGVFILIIIAMIVTEIILKKIFFFLSD